MKNSEKRQFPRHVVSNLQGTMLLASEVRIINVSIGGVQIEADRRLERGREYALKLRNGDSEFSVVGRIQWAKISRFKKLAAGESVAVYKAGVQFSEIADSNALALLKLVAQPFDRDDRRNNGLRFLIAEGHQILLEDNRQYQVKKISMGGMLIESDHELEPEQVFAMELSLDGEPCNFNGRITSCHKTVANSYEIGIAFSDLEQEYSEKLALFIEHIEKNAEESTD